MPFVPSSSPLDTHTHAHTQTKKEKKRKINQDAESLFDSSPNENLETNIPKEKKLKKL